MIENFKIINKNRPVPEFLKKVEDMDGLSRIKAFREYLSKNYREYISKSEHPQRPNINLDNFINQFDKKYKIASFITFDSLTKWFEEENSQHRITLMEKYKGNSNVEKILEKIELGTRTRHGKRFYLGSYWLDNPQNKLSITIRRKAWNNWFSQQPAEFKNEVGEILCPCCEDTYISAFQFEAGHKRSFKNGGSDEISNLIPICGTCNRSMGVMDYDTYKNSLA
jgi:5-methylcytosine-specific restriction endonuclease McrA